MAERVARGKEIMPAQISFASVSLNTDVVTTISGEVPA
jgi:hypothetical protein